MAPSTKKRKEPPPNCTLMDFFSGADATKRARVKPSRQMAPGVQQTKTKIASREVIVIESDSDDSICGKKKESAQLDSRTVPSGALTPGPSDKDIFGVPSELLYPAIPCVDSSGALHVQQQSPVMFEPDQSKSMFGISAPLLEETCTELTKNNQSKSIAQENTSAAAEHTSADDFAVGFSIGEWCVADDELAAPEALDDSASVDEGEPFNEYFCPVCGMDLTGIHLELQTHVNQCLDKASQDDNFSVQGCPSGAMVTKPNVNSDGDSPATLESRGNDLYTVLMNSHRDNEIWVEADTTVDRESRSTRGTRRRTPFYKVLQGMPIAVDAFCYGTIPGVTAYFLTHAHSDHYTNLGSKWNSGPIYCSEETANLIIHMLAVNPSLIHPLPLDTPTVIPNTGGVSVTLIEANHCPGSCLFFFEGQQAVDAGDRTFKSPFVGSPRIFRYLHCGDFRASPRHVLHPALNGKHIDHVYLDTTYLDSKYTFAPQPLVISACAELARRLVMADDVKSRVHSHQNSTLHAWMKSPTSAVDGGPQILQERVLVIVGTYSVGKERIVKGVSLPVVRTAAKITQAIARALGVKIYCDPRKAAILRCQADKELHTLLTADPTEAGVHILPLGTITSDNLKLYLRRFKSTFSRVIGFRPTGWTYSPASGSDSDNASIQSIIARGQLRHFTFTDIQSSQKSSYLVQIFGVPYSEHSSFFELTCFAMSCDWGRIIPTVNVGSATSRAKMTKWFKRWESEKKSMKSYVIQPRTADYW